LAGLFCVGGTSESGNSRSAIVGSIVNVNGCVGSVPMKLVAEAYIPGSDTNGKVFTTRTDAQGSYRFEDVPTGLYYLNARCLGKKLLRGPIEIKKPEEDLAVDSLRSTARVTLRIPDTGKVNAVFLKGTDESYTAAPGLVVLDSVPTGSLSIVGFTKQGDVPQTLTSANSIQLTITLTPADIVTAAFDDAPPTITVQPGEFSKFVKLADSVYKTTIVANDPENDAIRFHVLSAPSGLSVDSISGNIIWRPDLSIPLADYRVGVQVADIKGSSRSIWWTISVVESFTSGSDTIAPVIKLLGADSIRTSEGQPFVDPGFTATDNVNGTITGNVLVTGSVDVGKIGIYKIYYNVKDAAGNAAETKTRTVLVLAVDTTGDPSRPEIILLGRIRDTLHIGDSWKEPGYTVSDNRDTVGLGDSVKITIIDASGAVVPTVVTTAETYFRITYTVKDKAGNTSDPKMRIIVVSKTGLPPEPSLPKLTLKGNNPDSVLVGSVSAYNDPGATATDYKDNDISGSIVVTGTVDVSTVGLYTLTYRVVSMAGDVSVSTRKVAVVSSGH
jgi:hypothetical protein